MVYVNTKMLILCTKVYKTSASALPCANVMFWSIQMYPPSIIYVDIWQTFDLFDVWN